MRRETLSDTEVEIEIARLQASEKVKLAQKEVRIKIKRRTYLYQLRLLEKRGKELAANGITFDNIEQRLFGDSDSEE